jgi:hypothetical protein
MKIAGKLFLAGLSATMLIASTAVAQDSDDYLDNYHFEELDQSYDSNAEVDLVINDFIDSVLSPGSSMGAFGSNKASWLRKKYCAWKLAPLLAACYLSAVSPNNPEPLPKDEAKAFCVDLVRQRFLICIGDVKVKKEIKEYKLKVSVD